MGFMGPPKKTNKAGANVKPRSAQQARPKRPQTKPKSLEQQQQILSASSSSSSYSPRQFAARDIALNDQTLTQPTLVANAFKPEVFESLPDAQLHSDDCICTICVCGKHRCPATPHATHYDSSIASENHDRYRGVGVPPAQLAQSTKFPPSVLNPQKFNANTIYQDDYKQYEFEPRNLARTSAIMHDTGVASNNAPFNDHTTHKDDYKKWNGAKPAKIARSMHWSQVNDGLIKPDNRDFKSEHRSQYDQKPLPKRRPPPETQQPSTMPFDGNSTQKDDYKHWLGARPAPLMKRAEIAYQLPDDRDFVSEHGKQFTHKHVQACPATAVSVSSKPKSGHLVVEKSNVTGRFQLTGKFASS